MTSFFAIWKSIIQCRNRLRWLWRKSRFNSAFRDLDTFEVNITRVLKFLNNAIFAINEVKIKSRIQVKGKTKKSSVRDHTVKYEFDGDHVIFSRVLVG